MQHQLVTDVKPLKRHNPKKMWFKNDLNVLRSELCRVPGFLASQTKRPPAAMARPAKMNKRIEITTHDHSLFIGRQAVEDRQNLPFNCLAERGKSPLAAPLNKEAIVPIGNFHLSSLWKNATCVRIYFLFCCC